MKVSAPGKVVLLGEYAVVEQGRALVAAVDARAWGASCPPGREESAVVLAVRKAVGAPAEGRGVDIDTGAFRDELGHKLGVGSSAAAAVVAAAVLRESTDDDVLSQALAGHRAAAEGRGSGIDAAVSYHGGVIVTGRQPGPVAAVPSGLPRMRLHVFRLGAPVSTSEFLHRCQVCSDWSAWIEVLTGLAEEGIQAYCRGRVDPFRSAVSRYARALDGLGRSADVPIVTDVARALAQAAMNAGGVAKTSGAGGGRCGDRMASRRRGRRGRGRGGGRGAMRMERRPSRPSP